MHFAYINTDTLQYPIQEGDIRLLHADIDANLTGEQFPCPQPFAPVLWTIPPTVDALTQIAEQINPEFVNNQWQAKWSIRELSDAEKAAIAEMLAKKQEEEVAAAAATVEGE